MRAGRVVMGRGRDVSSTASRNRFTKIRLDVFDSNFLVLERASAISPMVQVEAVVEAADDCRHLS